MCKQFVSWWSSYLSSIFSYCRYLPTWINHFFGLPKLDGCKSFQTPRFLSCVEREKHSYICLYWDICLLPFPPPPWFIRWGRGKVYHKKCKVCVCQGHASTLLHKQGIPWQSMKGKLSENERVVCFDAFLDYRYCRY